MSSILSRIAAGIAISGASLLILGIGCYAVGVCINTSTSIPVGVYWTSSKPIEKGAYVIFCPSQTDVFFDAKERGYIGAGFCPGDYGYMMKKILAAKNDAITITDEGVQVNGKLLPFSTLVKSDKNGYSLPRYPLNSYTLGHHEVLLMSDVSATSFDSRYFGPIHRSQIKSVIFPVLTW